jgi:Ca-activated chloride channel family protein
MTEIRPLESRLRALLPVACLAAGLVVSPANARPAASPLPKQETSAPAPGRDGYLPLPDAVPGSPFLLRQTDVRTTVTGPVAHVEVTQSWENPNTFPVDGLYIFPLPENAAVNDMSLRIGERLIQGQMHRREEARAIYEQARQQGQVAGLLDQERPNVFVQRVANIMPGVGIDVILAMDHEVPCESGTCEYVYPTVVGPRFVPARQPDPGLINPPVVEEGSSTGQTLSLSVDLQAGVPISDLRSPSHRVILTTEDESRARAVLAEGEASRLNRDFRLQWQVGSDQPELGILTWRDPVDENDFGVFTLILQPPVETAPGDAAPRELVFVLDCSGSMSGVPIEASKNVVRQALRAVRPQDTFQIIRFSENASGLGPSPLTPTPENIRRALAYLDALQGQGGTEMIAGIRAALSRPADTDRLRIVAFLTDGYIGNEREILAEVRRTIGSARLFSFGIGSSVNRYLLEGLAEEGRGAAAFLGPRETADEMVTRFIRRISTPVLTDIRITLEDLEVTDLEPARIPDLFAGQSVLIHGRYRQPQTGVVIVEGRRLGRFETLRQVAALPGRDEENEALGRLWARARIHRLNRQLHDGHRDDVKEMIVQIGLRHHLMTAWTSLVAVDTTVSNPYGPASQMIVPVEMPEDVSYEGVFGKRKVKTAAMVQPSVMAPGRNQSAKGGAVTSRLGARAEAYRAPGYAAQELAESDAAAPEEKAPVSGSGFSYAPGPAADEKEELRSLRKDGLDFRRIVLTLVDGTRIVVEEDGEVWKLQGRSRTLMAVLDASQVADLRNRIATAGAASWPAASQVGRGTASRLLIEADWGTTAVFLPAADEAVNELAGLLERLGA